MAVKKEEECNVTGEPIPETSQDHFSSSDSENIEEESGSETWTIVNQKKGAKTHAREKCDLSFLRKRQCEFHGSNKHRIQCRMGLSM